MDTSQTNDTLSNPSPKEQAANPTLCPLCASNRLTRVCEVETWSTYQIELCRDCGFVFAAPRPNPEELDRFYTSTYFERNHQTNLGYANYRSVAEINARHMWHDLRKFGPISAPTKQRLLDVGCATGGFLAEAKADGWDCLGVELSEYAIEVARKEFGLNVLRGDVFHADLERESFGLVTMWHVLEHIIDPLSTLKRARELLLPNGMVFVELPNWNSLGRRVKRQSWSQLKPPEHINFFTPRSLSAAARQAGFRVIRCTSEYPSIMNEAAVRRPSRPWHQARAAIASAACALGCGGYVRLLAQKA